MNENPSTPDPLDRLFAVLVRTVRDRRPELLASGLDVADLLSAVPYKRVRTEIGVATDDDYGHTMTRLLSGERGLLFVDDLMQDDLRAELDSKNSDLQAYRSYLNSRVTLAQERVREVLDALGTAPASAAFTDSQTAAPPRPASPPARKARAAPDATAASIASPRPAAPNPPRERPHSPRPNAVPNAIALMAGGVEPRSARPGCKYCAQPLPHGRDVRFCPHCGQDLSVMRCAACSADLEPGWKFCVTCGRAATA
ncbi:MAG: zinc ribbon domain-containing protein [Gemmatimonadetes bacterium]|nr:zinc ribbon domain-containing protein [Gemmatimonadota bacterium]